MYNSQITKMRIKQACKSKKVDEKELLQKCELGVNAIRQINDNKGMSSFSLAKIADYLDCSVDYLLGREKSYSSNNVTISGNSHTGDISGGDMVKTASDQYIQEISGIMSKLSVKEQTILMAEIYKFDKR